MVEAPVRPPRPSADPTRGAHPRRRARPVLRALVRRCDDARDRSARRRDATVAQLSLPVEGRALACGGRQRCSTRCPKRSPRAADGLRGVDELTATRLIVREFIFFSARHPQLHRIITQECKVDGPRMDWLVERHIRPLYDSTVERFARLVERGELPDIPAPHLYYIVTGAGPTMFVLGPECRRLSGLDPNDPDVIEAHADAVCLLLFGR